MKEIPTKEIKLYILYIRIFEEVGERRINIQILKTKEKLEEIISLLPQSKLKEVIDFATYLREKEEGEEVLKIQMSSKVYKDWLGPKNDVYDEVFKNEVNKKK